MFVVVCFNGAHLFSGPDPTVTTESDSKKHSFEKEDRFVHKQLQAYHYILHLAFDFIWFQISIIS